MNRQYHSALTRVLAGIAVIGLGACSGSSERAVRQPSTSSELGAFMKIHVNPSFSKISFLLFHDSDSDSDLDPTELPASASALVQAAERLSKWPHIPGDSAQGKLVFTEYAEALTNDARNLVNALRDGKPDSMVKAFESLRKKCDACHHFFRYDETSTQDGRPAAGRPSGKP
jgi:cytochrome c556